MTDALCTDSVLLRETAKEGQFWRADLLRSPPSTSCSASRDTRRNRVFLIQDAALADKLGQHICLLSVLINGRRDAGRLCEAFLLPKKTSTNREGENAGCLGFQLFQEGVVAIRLIEDPAVRNQIHPSPEAVGVVGDDRFMVERKPEFVSGRECGEILIKSPGSNGIATRQCLDSALVKAGAVGCLGRGRKTCAP